MRARRHLARRVAAATIAVLCLAGALVAWTARPAASFAHGAPADASTATPGSGVHLVDLRTAVGPLVGLAAPAASGPAVSLLSASPLVLGAGGGTVHLLVVAVGAASCTIRAAPGPPPAPARCGDGTTRALARIPANGSRTTRVVRYVVTVAAGGRTASRAVAVRQAGTAPLGLEPRVGRQPRAVRAAPGSIVRFSATASGTPRPSVSWQERAPGGAWRDVERAHRGELRFRATSARDGWSFRAIFTNRAGSATSRAARLTVTARPAPTTTTEPASIGGATTTTAAVAPGPVVTAPAPASTAPASTAPASTAPASTAPASTAPASTSSTSTSTSAPGGGGTTTSTSSPPTSTSTSEPTSTSTSTTVGGGPTITEQPADLEAYDGGPAAFTAAASGSPPPSVQWRVSTDGGTSWTGVSGATSGTYSFTAARSENGYEFDAVFTGTGGATATTGAAGLVVAMTSSNWSGQVAMGSTYSAVAGTWTVPAVSCPSTGSTTYYSSVWVGIDGDGSGTVEQDGTEQDCSNGTASYYAWYEMYGDAAVNGGAEVGIGGPGFSVSPGDVVDARVSESGGSFTLSIDDHAWSSPFSATFSFPSATLSSAEWIVERPTVGSSLSELADFGTAALSAASATATGSAESAAAAGAQPIYMLGNAGVLAAAGTLDGTGGDFSVLWEASN